MKWYRYILSFLGALLFATSCSDEYASTGQGSVPENTPITFKFVAEVPKAQVETRSVRDVQNLTLMVFDENHRYLYRATAVLGAVVPTTPSDIVRPDGGRPGGINDAVPAEKREITVTLLSSMKKRIIHFVGNYDFDNYPPDYQIENMDEGELMPALHQEGEHTEAYWQVFDFNTIEQTSFDNIQFRLLRNQARISVVNAAPNFTYTGYCINNAPNKGTIAPFVKRQTTGTDAFQDPRGVYDNVLYLFPRDPRTPTIMANYTLAPKGRTPGALTNTAPLLVYEYRNKEAAPEDQLSIIVYGQRQGQAPAYYKVDLANKTIDAQGNYTGSELYDVVRNNAYRVTINKVEGNGYPTYEEAVRNPADNNIFASVELSSYSSVSDGSYALVVDNTAAVMSLPGRFVSNISFTDANNTNMNQNVKVYLNGNLTNGAITGDEFISYANFNPNLGALYVDVKKIPANEIKEYNFTVIGTGTNGVNMQRNIILKLHPRYHFNPVLTDNTNGSAAANPQGEHVELTFTVPGTLNANLFPYSIFIEADHLTPYVSAAEGINDGMKIVKKGTRIFYEYVVNEPPANGMDERRTIHFKRTLTDKSSVVTLVSDHFHDADVLLNESASYNNNRREKLYYMGLSYTEPRIMASRVRTSLTAQVTSGATPGVAMVTAGYAEFTFSSSAAYHNGADLTLTATMHHSGGDITTTKTMTLADWHTELERTDADAKVIMDIEKVEVYGDLLLSDWKTNPTQFGQRGPFPAPTGINFTVTNSLNDPRINATMVMTAPGKYKLTVSGLAHVKEPVIFNVRCNSGGLSYESYALYLGKLLDEPKVILAERAN